MSDSSKNATKHGCCAPATLILPTENKQDFEDLEISHVRFCLPKCDQERNLRQLTEALLAERLKAAQKKNEPQPGFSPGKSHPDWHQHLRNMRAEAVARGFVSPDEPNPFDKHQTTLRTCGVISDSVESARRFAKLAAIKPIPIAARRCRQVLASVSPRR